MTAQTMRLLEVVLTDPNRDWYGLELMELTDLRSGTTYPILHRLLSDGWLSSTREEVNPAIEGRPQRRLYRLTGIGQVGARKALQSRRGLARPIVPSRLKLGGATA